MERIKTGIEGFDDLIEGGFEQGSIVIIAAEAGSGKSTFAQQYLHYGAKELGEPALYITFEENKDQVFRHTKNFGMDFEQLEKDKKFFFMQYLPHEVDKFMRDGTIIEDLVRDNGVKRLVIDSITSFALLFENDYKRRLAILQLFANLKKWGVTAVITSEGKRTNEGEMTAKFDVDFLGDAYIAIHPIRRKEVRDLALEVVKMRGTNHSRKMVPLRIEEGKGVVLYPNQPVFDSAGF